MTLQDCTKEELIFIINHILDRHFFNCDRQPVVDACLNKVKHQRTLKLLADADRWNRMAADSRRKYIDLLKKYGGEPCVTIPTEVLKRINTHLADARYADRKWDECMRKVDQIGGER